MLEAFMDESGTHDGAGLLSVACCMGTDEQWSEFLEKWDRVDFHAKDPFSDEAKPRLAELIVACQLDALVCTVKPENYRLHSSTQWKSAIGDAYAACAFACVLGAKKVFPNTRIAYTIEDGRPNSEWVLRVLTALANTYEFGDSIASVALAKKRGFLQLHAADFLAHSWSTQDQKWMKAIGERVYEYDITPSLAKMSGEIKEVIRQRKAKPRGV